MTIALAMPLVLNAVRALMRYRERVDRVLSLGTAAEGLPFALPKVPPDMAPFDDEMRGFFRTGEGHTILVLHGLEQGFGQWDAALTGGKAPSGPALAQNFRDCRELYRRVRHIGPYLLQPQLRDPAMLQSYADSGPGNKARLAFFVVESDRLSRNPILSRILLVTADTLLEYLGENAHALVSNPGARSVVESLIEEFAGKQDFDDESAREIFRQLLGGAVTAVLDHRELLPDKPALAALFGAINDVRAELKEKAGGSDTKTHDTVSRLFGEAGLERIGRFFILRVAADPALVANGTVAREAVKAALREIVAAYDIDNTFKGIFAGAAARNRILEALIEVGASRAADLLQRKGADGRPFSATVLTALATSVRKEASQRQLFAAIAAGEVAGDLYAVALATVAANAQALGDETGIAPIVAELIAALAGQLVAVPFGANLNTATRDKLLSTALRTLAKHPEALVGDRKFASAVVAATLAAAAAGAADGFTAKDMETVIDAALRAAGDNASLAGLGEALAGALQAATDAVAAASLPALRSPAARKALLFAVIDAVNANPKLWSDEKARLRFQALVTALIAVVREGQARQLLGGAGTIEAFKLMLLAASRRAKGLFGRDEACQDLAAVLNKGWELVEEELGRTLDQAAIPAVLERIALAYCKMPFVLAQAPHETLDKFFDDLRIWLERP